MIRRTRCPLTTSPIHSMQFLHLLPSPRRGHAEVKLYRCLTDRTARFSHAAAVVYATVLATAFPWLSPRRDHGSSFYRSTEPFTLNALPHEGVCRQWYAWLKLHIECTKTGRINQVGLVFSLNATRELSLALRRSHALIIYLKVSTFGRNLIAIKLPYNLSHLRKNWFHGVYLGNESHAKCMR
jgi:hypothetical protein